MRLLGQHDTRKDILDMKEEIKVMRNKFERAGK